MTAPSPDPHPAERETPAGEAMREAVAHRSAADKRIDDFVDRYVTDCTLVHRTLTEEEVWLLQGLAHGPIASELARLTAHAECGHANADENYRRLQAAEAALTTLRADHAAEVARLKGAAALALQELDWQVEQAAHCGDPNYECPMQDIHAPGDGHLLARNALRAAHATTETTDA